MVTVMHSSMKRPGRTMAMALAFAPLGAVAVRAQQAARPPARSHTQICINGQCTDDTSRVVVLRLMDKVDSLKRIYLDKPITPDQRREMSEQMADWIRQLTDLSQNAMTLNLQQADEATRQAMNEAAAQGVFRVRVAPRMTADAAPKGWIGFTTAGVSLTDVRDGEYYVQFLDYPEVETVEPASPAERAGIVHGDVLVAFNGQDVTSRAISMTRMLRPDHKITVRMERDGQPRDFSVVVAKAPQNYVSRIDDFTAPRAPDAPVVASPPMPAPAPQPVFFPNVPEPPSRTVRAGSSFGFSFDDVGGVAGASMSTLNPDFARNLHLGVDHGILVINAPDGTPAARAGLRNADIIVKVDDDDVATVRELRRALQRRAGARNVELQIIRDKHKRTIRLNND